MATVTCPSCRERDQRIAALERRVAELEAAVRELLARLGTHATNSGTPPSANPPGAPKPVVKKPTGRKRGGQPGHAAHLKARLPPGRVRHVVPLVPRQCRCCQAALPAQPGPDDPAPTWHQVADLPVLAAEVTEYQGHYRTCPGCGTVNHAAIPRDLKAHSIGPRLAAVLGYLTGSHRVSRRGLEEIAEDVFEVPLSLGTVGNLQAELSAALAPAHTEALAAVRGAAAKNVDETSWKLAEGVVLAVGGGDRHGRGLPRPRPPGLGSPGGAAGPRGDRLRVQRPLERLRPAVAVVPPNLLGPDHQRLRDDLASKTP